MYESTESSGMTSWTFSAEKKSKKNKRKRQKNK